MDTLSTGRVAAVLQRLFAEAEQADRPLIESFLNGDTPPDQMIADVIAAEKWDLRELYREQADNFLNISPEFGRFLYMCARACNAALIVEFGTSMGVSAIHLAAALHDMGRGKLIGTELEPGKAIRARAHLEEAGLAGFVDIRLGDARETLREIDGDIDLVLLDGAFSLYLDVLKVLEPRFRAGTLIVAENAFEEADGYLQYVRDPANGYLSQSIPVNEGRGNEFTIVTRSPGQQPRPTTA
ncbi:MAG: class I SAM-dependent methyltransferase [Pseudomonadota bacterium]